MAEEAIQLVGKRLDLAACFGERRIGFEEESDTFVFSRRGKLDLKSCGFNSLDHSFVFKLEATDTVNDQPLVKTKTFARENAQEETRTKDIHLLEIVRIQVLPLAMLADQLTGLVKLVPRLLSKYRADFCFDKHNASGLYRDEFLSFGLSNEKIGE